MAAWLEALVSEPHHAWVVVGNPTETRQLLPAHLPAETVYLEWEQFGIDDGRFLKERQARRLTDGERQFWVVSWGTISVEAQNALLKTLEEPAPGHCFVLLVDSMELLLPTLLSRCLVLHLPTALPPETLARATKFWQVGPEARLLLVGELLREYEGQTARLRLAALALVNALVVVAHEGGVAPETAPRFRTLALARRRLGDRAALPRLILEHLALVL